MAAWIFPSDRRTSPSRSGRKESVGPELIYLNAVKNNETTPRRYYEPLFNSHPSFEVDIEDRRLLELEPSELASRIVRAVEAGEWAHEADVDDQERLASCAALGIRIGSLRRACGMSLDELALCTGMDADVLFAIELGLASAVQVAQHLERIAEALGDPEGELRTMLMQFHPVR